MTGPPADVFVRGGAVGIDSLCVGEEEVIDLFADLKGKAEEGVAAVGVRELRFKSGREGWGYGA